MRDKPLVSVVIPAYQCSHLIQKAIDSVLIQDVEFEVLVIDDGSSDDLDQVMRQYEDDKRVRYIKNEENMGVAATRNRGVRLAEGRYIAFLDADDWWAHGKLKHQLSAIRESDAVLCSTARELVTPEGKRTGRVISVPQKITYHMMLSHNCIACSSVLVKREVMMAVPMEHEDCHEDYLAWLKILREYGDGCGINEPLLKYRLSSAGKSGNKFHAAKMTWKVYQYMGFSAGQSMWCFIRYAFCGVGKYAKAVLGQKGKAQ